MMRHKEEFDADWAVEAYKFESVVLEDGIIQIPEISQFAHRPVEVFIVFKQPDTRRVDAQKRQTMTQFLSKWTGFLKGVDPDDVKLEYLQEKYE
ncbi:hypothetical protein GF339_09345 [candidate division KSB3 bacterium]|uniref:Uncharacterized protein n=1 Tax=candidate division KSB3 bacterium TaxID=2044937 RepID=A0A9D5Q603_9BACT|nr:hypothetical protein [candidate division KSB3 bacterium]